MEVSVRQPGNLRFGTFELDLEAGELRKHGIRIKLQEQQFQILTLLAQHPGKLVTREELRHALWPDHTFVDFDRNLNKAINKLRVALCDSAEAPRFIETLHRRGYRFVAPVSSVTGVSSSVPLASLPELRATGPQIQQIAAEPPQRVVSVETLRLINLRGRLQYGIAAAITLTVCAAGAFYMRQRLALPASVAFPVKLRRSVAVLGFKNLSARPDEAWVSTALADWLTTDLSAGGQLRVIPTENVARMQIELGPLDVSRLSRDTLSRIGTNLGTDLVAVGSYAMLGGSSGRNVRLDLRLQDTNTGETVDALSTTSTEANLLDLVARAGQQLRAKLDIEAVSTKEAAEIAVTLPSNHDAARLYSQGLEKLRVFNALVARDLLQQSIAIEPSYALSHSALASAWADLGYDKLARGEAKKAYELSSNLGRADRLLVAARYHEISASWNKAIEIYSALFEFFPDSLEYGLALANAQFNGGKGQDALDTVRQLQRLPPPLGDDPRIDLIEAHAAESLGSFKQDLAASVRAGRKASVIGASLLLAQARAEQAWALTNLASPAEATAAADEARQIFAAAGDKRGVALAIGLEGIVLENQGNAVAAQAKYEEALATDRQIGSQLGVAAELDDLADTSFALGNLERSRQYYEQAMATYREVGHENGICLVKGALAPLLMDLGDNHAAINTAQEAVAICRRLGDRSKAAIALVSLAKALRQDGRIVEAKSAASEATSMFLEIGDRQSAVRAKLIIAQTLVDERNGREAQLIARAAADDFEDAKAARDAALAYAVLARASLAAKDISQARQAVQRATDQLSNFHDREVELAVAISAGRLRASAPDALNDDQAAQSLEKVAAQANHLGFVAYEFEPRLVLAEMEIRAGDLRNGRVHLHTLAKEATDRGFGLIALEASGELENIATTQQ
ncbi:MAG: winged helix-turn-helix domain-containing protein [Acidobacteria bacterium]|nr:winged helix-turn-helix domain-containing protein [Acidobacteriota bacterium]